MCDELTRADQVAETVLNAKEVQLDELLEAIDTYINEGFGNTSSFSALMERLGRIKYGEQARTSKPGRRRHVVGKRVPQSRL